MEMYEIDHKIKLIGIKVYSPPHSRRNRVLINSRVLLRQGTIQLKRKLSRFLRFY